MFSAKSMPNMFESIADEEGESEDKVEDSEPEAKTVAVPRLDDDSFTSFFESNSMETISAAKINVTVDDFNHIFLEAEDM